ncbi:MAG: WbqC family protein [Flavobacteriales bacterium]|nr:WbqC family protein [Flavobacteriales bacterium]MEB2340553.1 WbqC family protein [Flavobacteriia bacterium]
MPGTPLFSAFYFGSVEHYALIARHPRIIIDTGEHYLRQSYRTRTGILGANGMQQLQVHIARQGGQKMPMHGVGLSYDEPWHARHLHAIRSAYGKTPWFIHFIGDIEAVLRRRHDRLVDLDLATLHMALGWLGMKTGVEVRERYVEQEEVAALDLLDLRTALHPKKALPPAMPAVAPYTQVFADRHGFHGRLSIIDLVMNCGPEACRVLARC